MIDPGLTPPVVHYTHAARSGAARYVASLVEALARAGTRVTLVCPTDFEYADALGDIPALNVRATLPSLATGRNRFEKALRVALQSAAGLRGLRAERASRPIVHVNFVLGAAPDVWCRATRTPLVLTVHDVRPHKALLPGPLARLEARLLRCRYRLADRLVVHTQEGAAALTGTFGVPSRRITIIPHGAFTLGDAPIPYEPGPDVQVLLFGALREYKGVHLGIRAVQELRAAGAPVRLVIAGQPMASEREYWRSCLELVGQRPEGIDVREGYVPMEEVPALLAPTHVVLLPYTHFDSQSGVASLALANGRPIAATPVGGLAELLRPGVNGFAIRKATVEATRAALSEAIDAGHERLSAMGRAAAERIAAECSWEAIASRHVAVYRTLASEGTAR